MHSASCSKTLLSPPELLVGVENNGLRGDLAPALPEGSKSWAQCRQKAPAVAAVVHKQNILCPLLLCLPDFSLILEKVIFLRYNGTEI